MLGVMTACFFVKNIFADLQNKYQNFGIGTIYGENLNIIMCLIIILKNHPQYIIRRVPQEANDLAKITNEIQKTFPNLDYRADSSAQSGKN